MVEGVGSMRETFEMVEQHEEIINDNILPRIEKIEKAQEEFTKEVAAMRASQTSLELTFMKESQTNRQQIDKLEGTLTAQSDSLFEIVRTALGMKATTDGQEHELKMAKWNVVSTIFLKVSGGLVAALGSGGLIYLAFQKFVLEK